MVRFRHHNKGVTLIEMLVVIAIIGVIAGIGIPNFTGILRRGRVRTQAIELLAVIRNERGRAISLDRAIEMVIHATGKYYTVTRLAFILYDPLSSDPDHPDILNEEDAEMLVDIGDPAGAIDREDWLEAFTVNPDPLRLVFAPSGMIEITGGVVGSVTLSGYGTGYEIKIYKGGQIDIFRL